jgi:hypothetical protein
MSLDGATLTLALELDSVALEDSESVDVDDDGEVDEVLVDCEMTMT